MCSGSVVWLAPADAKSPPRPVPVRVLLNNGSLAAVEPLEAGALAALLAPDWTYYPPFSFMSAIGFIAHIAIILYILQAIWSRLITPSIKRAYIPVQFLAVYALIMIPFDRHFNVNYGFLNDPSPGSILVPLAERFGYGLGYYVGYALLVLAGILISYALCALLTKLLRPSAS